MLPFVPFLVIGRCAHPAEGENVQAGARALAGNGAERSVMPVLIAETIFQDFDQNVLVFPAAAEQDPGKRQAAVGLSGSSAGSRNADGPAGHGEKVLGG